jgi:glucuronate isomerase
VELTVCCFEFNTGRHFINGFMNENFLLESDAAVELYHKYAAGMPVIDYHNHLPPRLMAEDYRFKSLAELWLSDDHYKWRAMRANGVPERFITGDGSDWEKFEAWAATVPATLRNPLYHWTHMELGNAFGIQELLSKQTARKIYDQANEKLKSEGFTTLGLLEKSKVAVVCTTDDPVDSLEFHDKLAKRKDLATRVYPTWRPDKALAVEDPQAWNGWVNKLESASGISIGSFDAFLKALEKRHDFFHEKGCRASDNGLEQVYAESLTEGKVEGIFDRFRAGKTMGERETLKFKSALLHHLALLNHVKGWVQQFHLGALRSNNTRLRKQIGTDAGFDSIGDFEQAKPLSRFLDRLDETGQLAKTILYNLNPADNEAFAAMCGNFQDGSTPGKMQYGAAWWFLDQKDGIEAQLRALSNLGLLSRFVGMVTDSRSFLSYSRHEYFRRILCNLLGEDVRKGLLPDDRELLGQLVRDVCFFNARDYFSFPLGRAAAGFEKA